MEDDARIRSILDAIVTTDASKYTKDIDREYIRYIRDSELNIRMHLDGGANRSVTSNDLRLLNNIRNIPDYSMYGAQKGEATIRCTKVGYMKLILSASSRESTVKGPGQMFHMDFGFVRGTDFKEKESDGKIIALQK